MSARGWPFGSVLLLAFFGAVLLPLPLAAQGSETAGVITEIKVGRGRVEVKPSGAGEWRQAGPLLALRAGDEIRATEDALVVILLSGGRGSINVARGNSPFVIPAAKGDERKGQKARVLLEASLNFLSSAAKELPRAMLSTRGGEKPPVVLTPRNGRLLPGSLTFEWNGNRFSRYTVRVLNPKGLLFERKELPGARFDYPSDAPPLVLGVRYTIQVLSRRSHPPQEAWFELVDPIKAEAVRRDLEALEQLMTPIVSPNSLAAIRVGFFAREGLVHDARLVLTAALAKDPDEPTLHLLLGNLYLASGLPDFAAQSYDEAKFLLTRESAVKR